MLAEGRVDMHSMSLEQGNDTVGKGGTINTKYKVYLCGNISQILRVSFSCFAHGREGDGIVSSGVF